MKNVSTFLTRVNARNFTNNTQRVLHRLLAANGGWIAGNELNKAVNSATARVRDLRKDAFGALPVECKTAAELNLAGGTTTFFYRINPRNITVRQVASVLVPR